MTRIASHNVPFAWPGASSADLRREARSLRAAVAANDAKSWRRAFDKDTAREVVQGSDLVAVLPRLPHPRPLELVAFTLEVSDRAVERALADQRRAPIERLFVASHIIEGEHTDLIDPRDPNRRHRNLAVPKEAGAFFSPAEVAWAMSWLARRHGPAQLDAVLDPAGGVGSLAAAALVALPHVRRVDLIERSPRLAAFAQRLLQWLAAASGRDIELAVHEADAIEVLAARRLARFPAVIMNPPYGRIRATADAVTNAETRARQTGPAARRLAEELRERAAARAREVRTLLNGREVGSGILERSRVFMRLALESVGPDGVLVAIGPSAWTGDQAAAPLRRWLVEHNDPQVMWLFRESNPFFPGVNHPLVISTFRRRAPQRGFRIGAGLHQLGQRPPPDRAVSLRELKRLTPSSLRIPRVSGPALRDLARLADMPRLGELSTVYNLRGELDLTVHRAAITKRRTKLRLVRGDHIERFTLSDPEDSRKAGYVARSRVPASLSRRDKWTFTNVWRVAGRQCSYLEKARRLSFVMVPPGVVLANSCNFIAPVDSHGDAHPPRLLWVLLGLLNSGPIEQWFRAFNSNNHVANYELDELPVPDDLDGPWARELATVAKQMQSRHGTRGVAATAARLEDRLDAAASLALGLAPAELSDALVPQGAARTSRVRTVMQRLAHRSTRKAARVA